SWDWVAEWIDYSHDYGRWLVLAAKSSEGSADYLGFLPLRMTCEFNERPGLYNRIAFVQGPYVDFAGVLVRPEAEAQVVPALTDYARRKLNWTEFAMDNVLLSGRRGKLFLSGFDKRRFTHYDIGNIDPDDPSLDHTICPWTELPSDWDD